MHCREGVPSIRATFRTPLNRGFYLLIKEGEVASAQRPIWASLSSLRTVLGWGPSGVRVAAQPELSWVDSYRGRSYHFCGHSCAVTQRAVALSSRPRPSLAPRLTQQGAGGKWRGGGWRGKGDWELCLGAHCNPSLSGIALTVQPVLRSAPPSSST
jgi:hypothetical protein